MVNIDELKSGRRPPPFSTLACMYICMTARLFWFEQEFRLADDTPSLLDLSHAHHFNANLMHHNPVPCQIYRGYPQYKIYSISNGKKKLNKHTVNSSNNLVSLKPIMNNFNKLSFVMFIWKWPYKKYPFFYNSGK